MSRGPRRGDRGSATVLVLAVIALVLAVAWTVSAVGAADLTRHRAALAADAAALAAAGRAVDGGQAACAAARTVARLDGAVVTGCLLLGAVAEVRTRVDAPRWLRVRGSALGWARAGPADISGTSGRFESAS